MRAITLIEALICLAIVAILIAIAVPNCARWHENQRPCAREAQREVQVCQMNGQFGLMRCRTESETYCAERVQP